MLKELLEKRAEAANKMQEIRNLITEEKRSMTAEEKQTFDSASNDYDKFSDDIEAIKRADDVEKNLRSVPGRDDFETPQNHSAEINNELRNAAFKGIIRSQLTGELRDNEKEAMRSLNFNPSAREFRFSLPNVFPQTLTEARALSTGTGAEGGFTIPEDFRRELEIALLKFGTMLELGTRIRTTTGADLPAPTVDDTANEATVIDEGASAAGGEDPTFGQVIFKAYKYTSKFIKISTELLEDSAFNLPAYLGRVIGERIGRGINRDCTVGDGTGKATGIVTSATSTPTGTAGTFVADDIIDLVNALDDAYDQNAVLMMNKSILSLIRKMKDSQGQYIWSPNYAEANRGTVLGYPVYKNSKMAKTVASGNDIAVFGDFSKYMIREVAEIRMKRLVELYAETDQEGFGGFFRADGHLLDAGTHPVYKLTVA